MIQDIILDLGFCKLTIAGQIRVKCSHKSDFRLKSDGRRAHVWAERAVSMVFTSNLLKGIVVLGGGILTRNNWTHGTTSNVLTNQQLEGLKKPCI